MVDEIKNRLLALRAELVDVCKVCGGVGYVVDNKTGFDQPCDCMKVFRWLKALAVSNIPNEYWTLELENLKVERDYKTLLNFYFSKFENAVKKALGIVFVGINGVGKTAMMAEIAKFAIIQGYRTIYTTNDQYLDFLTRDNEEKLNQIHSAQVILLDELEKVYQKEGSLFVSKKTEGLIRSSLSRGAIVIIAANSSEAELTEIFGDSTMSMLKRHNKIISVLGDDFSPSLENGWLKNLEGNFDYYHPAIVSAAQRKWEIDRKREEE